MRNDCTCNLLCYTVWWRTSAGHCHFWMLIAEQNMFYECSNFGFPRNVADATRTPTQHITAPPRLYLWRLQRGSTTFEAIDVHIKIWCKNHSVHFCTRNHTLLCRSNIEGGLGLGFESENSNLALKSQNKWEFDGISMTWNKIYGYAAADFVNIFIRLA